MRTHPWMYWRALWLMFALATASCDEDEATPTDVYVSFKSDLSLSNELSAVRVRVYRSGDNTSTATPISEHVLSPVELSKKVPVVIEKRAASEVTLLAQALGRGGASDPQIERRVKVRFQDGQSGSLQVFLGRVCQRKACAEGPDQTCFSEARGATCEGQCAAIDGPDNLPPWSNGRADWQPMLCGQAPTPMIDAGTNLQVDAGRAGDGGLGDAGMDAGTDAGNDAGGVACSPTLPSASCNTVAQCGCSAGKSCGVAGVNGTSLQLGCVTPGTIMPGAACSADTCVAGNTCVGSICRPFCGEDADCGSGGQCVTAVTSGVNAQPISGWSACFNSCNVDSECSTGCCRALQGDPGAGKLCLTEAACCAQAGASCTASSDCCGFAQEQAVCVTEPAGGAICRAACTTGADCQSGCCAPLNGGGNACFAASHCQRDCASANEPCQTSADCCGGAGDTQVCVDQGQGAICADRCTDNGQCQSGCCAALQVGGKVCAPQGYCQ